ncbi:hypothetical protein LTS15_004951 [Exophiala xenobiotica]|nr:hypothetical protein LTS15_004951 [Exophiala xenobiotica]
MSSNTIPRQYYFAFGSNMSLTQMAERCPGSTFIGKATLPGYRWQINQRHVANIVRVTEDSPSLPVGQADVVEGLVFSITDKDRRVLDRKEGIKLGAYERVVLVVLLRRHPDFAGKKTIFVRDRLQDESGAINPPTSSKETVIESRQADLATPEGPDIGKNAADEQPKPSVLLAGSPPSAKGPAADVEEIEAITYLSTKYSDIGLIRQEYVQRMESAICDAVKLDMSRDFVQRYLEPYVHGDVYQPEEDKRENPSTSDPSVSKKVLEDGVKKAESGPALHSAAGRRGEPTKPAQTSDQAHRAHSTKKKIHGPNSNDQPRRAEGDGAEK